MIERCPKCTGKKQIMGLGAMIVECPRCDGIGHVKADEPDKEPGVYADEVKKKPGRPKRS